MENGRFTEEERAYLLSLDAIDEVRARSLVYSAAFKKECMVRYRAGEKPGAIFASVGLPASLIGYKRIERAIYHWKEAEAKGALTVVEAPCVRHRRRIDTIKREKREAVSRQREIRKRDVAKLEAKLAKHKERAKTREQKIIAAQAAEIAALKVQVKALKALGTLAKRSQRAPETTTKSERFEVIFQLRSEDPDFNVSAACTALEVSRRGYYNWLDAAEKRQQRQEADLIAKAQIEAAYSHRGFKKGTRQVVDCLRRTQGVVMNRKKVIRITRKFDLAPKRKRKNPYHPIGADGLLKVAPNEVNRDFRKGRPLKVLSTDITYLPSLEGFSYLSAVIDCETDVVLGHTTSSSLEEKFVLDTFDQLKGLEMPDGVWACSDQGAHYTAKAYRDKLRELSIHQSMSRKACCWDNAPIESFWGRLKEQLGPTDKLTSEQIAVLIDDYVDYYNNERGQARLGWLTPIEYASKLQLAASNAVVYTDSVAKEQTTDKMITVV